MHFHLRGPQDHQSIAVVQGINLCHDVRSYWSWDLLEDDDRRLLRRLAVFAGGWTLESATGVTFDYPADHGSDGVGRKDGGARLATLDGFGRLVDRSLVAVDHTSATRYRMLETIRQYAADQLAASGETVPLRDRHLAVFRQHGTVRLPGAGRHCRTTNQPAELASPATQGWIDQR